MDKIVKPQNPLGRIIVVTPWQLSMQEILFVMLTLEVPAPAYLSPHRTDYKCECDVRALIFSLNKTNHCKFTSDRSSFQPLCSTASRDFVSDKIFVQIKLQLNKSENTGVIKP